MPDNDHAVRLQAVLDDLIGNRINLTTASARVRAMHFPRLPQKTVSQVMTDSCLAEAPEPDPPGSFRLISRAYVRGKLSYQQYEALAEAAAAAMKADKKAQPDEDDE